VNIFQHTWVCVHIHKSGDICMSMCMREQAQEPLELHGSTNPSDEQNQDTGVLGASIDNLKRFSMHAQINSLHLIEIARQNNTES